MVGLFRRWQQLAPELGIVFQSNYQVTRKAVSFEWDKRKTSRSRCRLKCKDTAYWSVQDGRLCCNAVCVAEWVMAKANRRIPMKVTSVLEQGHVICTIEIHVIWKTEKRNFGKLCFRKKKKKVKGNRFILPFDKTTTIKNKKKWFLRSNHQKWRTMIPEKRRANKVGPTIVLACCLGRFGIYILMDTFAWIFEVALPVINKTEKQSKC